MEGQINNIDKKIFLDKLFPRLNNTNVQKLLIDHETISYITLPYDAKKITEILINHVTPYKNPKECTIVDATGGAGGDTITFCNNFEKVISIEINDTRYNFLKHNLTEYGFTNISVLHGDSTLIIPKIENMDIIYVDPPWGGKDYKIKTNLRLVFGATTIEKFLIDRFNSDINVSIPKIIGLKLPKNYDIKYLFDSMGENFNVFFYELKKINIVIIEKKSVYSFSYPDNSPSDSIENSESESKEAVESGTI